jgi:hypothetical protein
MNQPNRATLWAALRLLSILAALVAAWLARALGGNILVILGSAVIVYSLFWVGRAVLSRRAEPPRG